MIRFTPVFVLIVVAGCAGNLSTQDAYATCEVLLDGTVATQAADDEVFAECVACHENCGDDCAQDTSSPPGFSCPD